MVARNETFGNREYYVTRIINKIKKLRNERYSLETENKVRREMCERSTVAFNDSIDIS